MKFSGLSLATIGFAILVIAIDFAVIRAAFLSARTRPMGTWTTAAHAGSSIPQP